MLLSLYFIISVPSSSNDLMYQENNQDLSRLTALIDWTKQMGLQMPKIKIALTDKGKTLVALEDIPAGELFRAPYKIVFDPMLNNSPEMRLSNEWKVLNQSSLSRSTILALLFISEKNKGKNSYWFHYMDNLTPLEDLNQPFLWNSKSDIEAIEPLRLREHVVNSSRKHLDRENKRVFHVNSLFKKITKHNREWTSVQKFLSDHPQLFPSGIFTYQNFEWATAFTWSHTFGNYRQV